MPTYYYQFDRTDEKVAFSASSTVSNEGHDISVFDGDPRGTARVADWSDFSSFNQTQFDALVEAFELPTPYNSSLGWCSYDGHAGQVNKYHKRTGRVYFFGVSWTEYYSGGWDSNNDITSSPMRRLHVGNWSGNKPIMVYFPNYKANGGHDSLVLNNVAIAYWNNANNRFESTDGLSTLTHDGTTWAIDINGSISLASLDGNNVPSYIDPLSSDIVWQNGSSINLPIKGSPNASVHSLRFPSMGNRSS